MPLNILLADDSMTAQNMGKKILSDAGYEVTTVSNGAAALKKISDRTPDLVILDIYMPGYTGLEVCERVKRAATTSAVPVLLSVGKLEPYREQDATAVRADGVIIKPFEASELITIVTNVILRASGASMDAATRQPISPTAIQAAQIIPEAAPEPPSSNPVDYSAELADLKSQAFAQAVTYGPTEIADTNYSDAPPPPVEMAMAAAAPIAVSEIEPDNSAPIMQGAEASSAMPYLIEEMLKGEERVPPQDSADHYSGPMLDVSPVENAAAGDVEVIEIPAPQLQTGTLVEEHAEPSAGMQAGEDADLTSQLAVYADAASPSPEELTATEVEDFLREHAARSGADSAPGVAVSSSSDAGALPGAPGAAEVQPNHPGDGPAEFAPDAQAEPLVDLAVPKIADDDMLVFEAPDFHPSAGAPGTPVFDADDEPFFALNVGSPAEPAAVVEEPAHDIEEPVVEAEIAPEAVSAPASTAVSASLKRAFAEPAPEEHPAVAEPEAAPAPSPLATEGTAESTPSTVQDFMFSVPMVLEAAAAMSLPEKLNPAPQAKIESADTSTSGAPSGTAEAVPQAALDEAAIAGAVQRVLDRIKPQIVAEIIRELTHRP